MIRSNDERTAIGAQAIDIMQTWARTDSVMALLCEVVCELHKGEAVHKDRSVGAKAPLAESLEALREEVAEVEEAAALFQAERERLASWAASAAPPDRLPLAELRHHFAYEAVQVAAVALAMAERLNRDDWREW